MSFMKGDLLTKTRKLVKGLAIAEPVWLKAMEQAPPVTFPRVESKVKKIDLPEDKYVHIFFEKHPCSKYENAIKICEFDPHPARVFGCRVLQLKEQGINEKDAMAIADMEYANERRAKKAAYGRLKKVSRLQEKRPPPNPYPSAIKETQGEERRLVRERFYDPEVRRIVEKMKDDRMAEAMDRIRQGGRGGRRW